MAGDLIGPVVKVSAVLIPAGAIIQIIFDEYSKIEQNEEQLSFLLDRCKRVIAAIDAQLEKEPPTDLEISVNQLMRNLRFVEGLMRNLSRLGFLKQMLRKSSIQVEIQEAHRRLSDCLDLFNVRANVDLREFMGHLEEARRADQRSLQSQLANFEKNDQEILKRLDILNNNQIEAMVAIQHYLSTHNNVSAERDVLKVALASLQRSTRRNVSGSLPKWTITSYDLDIVTTTEPVGVGSFGTVRKAKWDGLLVAVKEFPVEADRKMLLNEIKVWSELRHDHVVPFYGASITAKPPFIVCRFMKNGNVVQYLGNTPNANRVQIAHEIALGMSHIHSHNIIHGDLKGRNVLIDDSLKACITDFGLSTIKIQATSQVVTRMATMHTSKEAIAGTLRYMSPEAMMGIVSKESDVYSFAMTLYEIFTNYPPFMRIPDASLVSLITKENLRLTKPNDPNSAAMGLTSKMWDLICSTSTHNPRERPTFREVSRITEDLYKRWRSNSEGLSDSEEERPDVVGGTDDDDVLDLLGEDSYAPLMSKVGGEGLDDGGSLLPMNNETLVTAKSVSTYSPRNTDTATGTLNSLGMIYESPESSYFPRSSTPNSTFIPAPSFTTALKGGSFRSDRGDRSERRISFKENSYDMVSTGSGSAPVKTATQTTATPSSRESTLNIPNTRNNPSISYNEYSRDGANDTPKKSALRDEAVLEPLQLLQNFNVSSAFVNPQGHTPNKIDPSEVAKHRSRLGSVLEACEIRRELNKQSPGVYTADLRSSVHNYARYLDKLGKYKDALEVNKEAVELSHELVKQDPEENFPLLAQSLDCMAIYSGRLEYDEDAIEYLNKVIEIYKSISRGVEEKHLSSLAWAYQNQAIYLRKEKRYNDGIHVLERSIEIRMDLNDRYDGAYDADLALSYHKLALVYDDMEQYDEGLRANDQAVKIRRKLAQEDPKTYKSLLAESLHNKAVFEDLLGYYKPGMLDDADPNPVEEIPVPTPSSPKADGYMLVPTPPPVEPQQPVISGMLSPPLSEMGATSSTVLGDDVSISDVPTGGAVTPSTPSKIDKKPAGGFLQSLKNRVGAKTPK